MRNKATISSVLVLLLFGWVLAQQAPPSFRNFVAVGDGYTAGMINGSLNEEGQNRSYAALLARQVGTFMFRPLIDKPGVPNELVLIDPGPPPVIQPAPGASGSRTFPTLIPQNLAVPATTTVEALTTRPDLPLDSLTDLILGVPSLAIPQLGIPPLSQVELAYVLKPTFTVLWLGPDDVTRAALTGSAAVMTPLPALQQAYQTAVGTILASGSKVVVGNFPDVTVLPYLSSADEVGALVGLPVEVIGVPLGIARGDYVTATGLPLVPQILQGAIEGPLPPGAVLTSDEVVLIQTTVMTMNGVIAQLSAALGFPVVDVNSFLAEADAEGVEVAGATLTTRFLGGLYSLDGLYPTRTAHALIANLFIEKLSAYYGLPIPPVDVEAVAAQDPLFPSAGAEDFTPRLMSISPETFAWVPGVADEREEEPGEFDAGRDPDLSEAIVPLEGPGAGYSPRLIPGLRILPGPAGSGSFHWRREGGRSRSGSPAN